MLKTTDAKICDTKKLYNIYAIFLDIFQLFILESLNRTQFKKLHNCYNVKWVYTEQTPLYLESSSSSLSDSSTNVFLLPLRGLLLISFGRQSGQNQSPVGTF